jgi:hypothetical protein
VESQAIRASKPIAAEPGKQPRSDLIVQAHRLLAALAVRAAIRARQSRDQGRTKTDES